MSEQINHTNYTALLAIMESFCAAAPDMKVSEAWPLIQKVEANTRALSTVPTLPGVHTSVDATSSWIRFDSSSAAERIRNYMKDGKRLNAIRDLRAATSQSLVQANMVCEHYERFYMTSSF